MIGRQEIFLNSNIVSALKPFLFCLFSFCYAKKVCGCVGVCVCVCVWGEGGGVGGEVVWSPALPRCLRPCPNKSDCDWTSAQPSSPITTTSSKQCPIIFFLDQMRYKNDQIYLYHLNVMSHVGNSQTIQKQCGTVQALLLPLPYTL